MVRNYKKKRTRSDIDEEAMSSAIKDVIEGRLSFRKAAEKYNIKSSTLQSRVIKMRKQADCKKQLRSFGSKYTSCQVFSTEEESHLNKYVSKCSKMHYGLTILQVRKLAYEYAKNVNCKYPPSWDENQIAGVDWMNGFRQRNNNLSLRKPENTSAARSFGFNKTAVNEFYTNLEKVYTRHKFTADRIYNFDESGISTVLSCPKVFAEKTQKQVGQLVSAERGELITFGGIISASGNTLPPLFVFPRVHYKDYFIHGAPEGSLGVATKSGWINSQIFVDVLKHIQHHTLCSKENPILLLCDNHESHVTIEAINYARDNGIVYLSFPPHTSHRLQPLDVGVFGPFKSKLKTAFNDWHISNVGKTLTIYEIPKIAKTAYYQSFTAKNIISGFTAPGIWPFNTLAFGDEDFAPIQVYTSVEEASDTKSNDAENIPINQKDAITEASLGVSTSSDTSLSLPVTSPPLNKTIDANQTTPPNVKASTSKTLITPEMICPYPKVFKKASTKKGRQPGRSRIYTDSPEKDRLQELQEAKEKKRMEKEKRNKAKEIKQALSLLSQTELRHKKKKTKMSKIRTSSESSNSDISVSLKGSSDSSFNFDEENDHCLDETSIILPEKIKDGEFILIKFAKKKSVVHYVGRVISHYSLTEYKVSFLRKKPGSWTFVFPNIIDDATVDITDVILVLPNPPPSGTARTSTMFSFPIDLCMYNVQ